MYLVLKLKLKAAIPDFKSGAFDVEAKAEAAILGLTAGVPETEAKAEAAIPGLTAGVYLVLKLKLKLPSLA